MAVHESQQGECLSSMAHSAGLLDWRAIYMHGENAELRKKRDNPNVIAVGDEVFVPEPQPREEDRPTEALHRFVRKEGKVWLKVVLRDAEDKPLAGRKFRLEVEQRIDEGTTDGDGKIERRIAADAQRGKLSVWVSKGELAPPMVWELDIGKLEPVETDGGVQARLNNLGFDCGEVDGIIGPRTREAIRGFQNRYGLDADGVAGPKTRAKLTEVYGC